MGIAMQRNARSLAERIQALNAEQLAELEEFIDFLRFRAQDRDIVRVAGSASEAALQAIWANPEDDVYDAL